MNTGVFIHVQYLSHFKVNISQSYFVIVFLKKNDAIN